MSRRESLTWIALGFVLGLIMLWLPMLVLVLGVGRN